MNERRPWAIVLAAGEGTRLRSLTTDRGGRAIPKQFCSLGGGPTLLERTLARAEALVGPERVVVVVAQEHAGLWAAQLAGVPPRNVVVQPRNRGTAAGLLLPLAAILARDPLADVVVLPSDHFVHREGVLRTALLEALGRLAGEPDAVTLLGIAPHEDVLDYGWILPVPGPGRMRAIRRFVEKPTQAVASDLLGRGGLWNSFLMVARGSALVALYKRRLPGLLSAFEAVDLRAPPSVESLYERLAPTDFSRHVLEGGERHLRVFESPPCGWTDLGTPRRVAQCLLSFGASRARPAREDLGVPVLAQALERDERWRGLLAGEEPDGGRFRARGRLAERSRA